MGKLRMSDMLNLTKLREGVYMQCEIGVMGKKLPLLSRL